MHKTIHINILSRMTMHDPKDFSAWIKLNFDMLPNINPRKTGVSEPFRDPFNSINDIQMYLDNGGFRQGIFWEGFKNIRCEGGFFTANKKTGHEKDQQSDHAKEYLDIRYTDKVNINEVINYVKTSSVDFKSDISFIDMASECYYPERFITTFNLKYWLEQIYWVTIFGDAYVRLFGMDKLLSVPAYKVEQLNDDTVYIQLTENINDTMDVEKMSKIRQAVQEHLGNAFYDPDGFYNDIDRLEYKFKNIDPGELYDAPVFNLLSDDYMDRNEIWNKEQLYANKKAFDKEREAARKAFFEGSDNDNAKPVIRVALEEQIEVLKKFGIIKSIDIEEILFNINRDTLQTQPYSLLMTILGTETTYNDIPKKFSNTCWYLDKECIVDNNEYPKFANLLQNMASVPDCFSELNYYLDEASQNYKLSFRTNNKKRNFKVKEKGDWVDMKTLKTLMSCVEKCSDGAFFEISSWELDDLLIVFVSEEHKDDFEQWLTDYDCPIGRDYLRRKINN